MADTTPPAPAAKKPGALDFLKKIGALVMGPQSILGVDLGSHSVKLAWFTPGPGDSLTLAAHGVLPVEVAADATPEDRATQVSKLIRDFVHEHHIQHVAAATSVSGTSVIVRYGKFPSMPKADMAKALPTEAEPLIPFDIKEAILSFYVLGEVEEEGAKRADVVLAAAKRDIIQNRIDVLRHAGLPPAIVDVDAFALENVHEKTAPAGEAGGTLYLNIGNTVTNLSIVESPAVTRVARDVFVAGTGFTKACQKALQGDLAAADQAKRSLGILVSAEEKEAALTEGNTQALGVSQALSKVADELLKEVHRSVDYYLSQGAERSISRVVLSGGSANIKGLTHYMAQELKVPVEVLNPFAFLPDQGAAVAPEARPQLAVAVGLALRRMKDWV